MKTFFLTMLFLTQTLLSPASQAENFVYNQDSAVITKYGDYAFKAVRKPEILKAIREVDPSFKTREIETSFPTKVTKVDGRIIVIFGGCTPHNCGDTGTTIFIEDATKKTYLIKQDGDSYRIFGTPDQKMKEMMINFFETQ